MPDEFVLKSHDFGDDTPRRCSVVSRPQGQRPGTNYLIVEIDPALRTTFCDEPERDFDRLLLALVEPATVNDIGMKSVFADIVLCPLHTGNVVDETQCARIGVGTLHPIPK
jgi:hypothetical protein